MRLSPGRDKATMLCRPVEIGASRGSFRKLAGGWRQRGKASEVKPVLQGAAQISCVRSTLSHEEGGSMSGGISTLKKDGAGSDPII